MVLNSIIPIFLMCLMFGSWVFFEIPVEYLIYAILGALLDAQFLLLAIIRDEPEIDPLFMVE